MSGVALATLDAGPQEVILIRPALRGRHGRRDLALPRPRGNKMAQLDRRKVIMVGPRAQEVLRPWLDRDPETYCFVPAETSAWHYRRLRRGAAAEIPGEVGEPRALKLRPGMKCTRHGYRAAVQRVSGPASPRGRRGNYGTRGRR